MKKVYIGAAAVALLLAVAIFFFAQGIKNDTTIDTKTATEVAVAVIEIPEGEVITAEMFQITAVPNVSLIEGVYTKETANELIGKIAADNVYVGDQITNKRAVDKTSSLIDRISYTLEEGYRAVTVLVSEKTATGYYVRPGDYVDMVSTSTRAIMSGEIDELSGLDVPYNSLKKPDEEDATTEDDGMLYEIGEAPSIRTSSVLLDKCLVIAVGSYGANQDVTPVGDYSSITLALPTNDALTYLYESSMADEITLILRHPDDETSTNAEYEILIGE